MTDLQTLEMRVFDTMPTEETVKKLVLGHHGKITSHSRIFLKTTNYFRGQKVDRNVQFFPSFLLSYPFLPPSLSF